jgi:hypothetical protein
MKYAVMLLGLSASAYLLDQYSLARAASKAIEVIELVTYSPHQLTYATP